MCALDRKKERQREGEREGEREREREREIYGQSKITLASLGDPRESHA